MERAQGEWGEGDINNRTEKARNGVNGGERNRQAGGETFQNLVYENWLNVERMCKRVKYRYSHPRLCYGVCRTEGCTGIHKKQAERMLEQMRRERERVKEIKGETWEKEDRY